jgi:hypothetical protein
MKPLAYDEQRRVQYKYLQPIDRDASSHEKAELPEGSQRARQVGEE